MVSPINTDWYQDGFWTGTLEPAKITAASEYTAAAAALSSSSASFTTNQTALANAINSPAATLASVQAALTSYNTAATPYLTDVTTFFTKNTALIGILSNQVNYVNLQATTRLTSYVNTLKAHLGESLDSNGVVTSTLGSQLDTANNTRISLYNIYLTKLSEFRTAVTDVNTGRKNLATLQSQLLVAKANLKIAQLTVPQNSGDIAAAQLSVDSFTTQVAAAQSLLTSDIATRDSAKTALLTAITNYKPSIATLSDLLEESAGTTSIDISAIQEQVEEIMAQDLLDAAAADEAFLEEHNLSFPTSPEDLLNAISEAEDTALANIIEVMSNQTGIVPNITGSIQMPKLEPGKVLSISDLMRFISAIQLLISQLSTELLAADRNISAIRSKVWQLQISLLTSNTAAVNQWIGTIQEADTKFQVSVAKFNIQNSEDVVDAINNIRDNITYINNVISQYNAKILAQNTLNSNTVTALNNANFIAVDVANQTGTVVPDDINNSDAFNEDTNISYPATVNDSSTIDPLPTIPLIPPLSTSMTIPSSFPIEPENPFAPVNAHNLPITAPSPTDINAVNDLFETINKSLLPIIGQLGGPPVNYTFLHPFFLRTSLNEIRTLPELSTITAASDITSIIFATIISMQQLRDQRNQLVGTFDGIIKDLSISSKPVTIQQFSSAQPLGGGAGILNANILGSQTKIASAVSNVIASGNLIETINSLTEQGALIGGLTAISKLPTKVDNYSQLGLVRSDQLNDKDSLIKKNTEIIEKEALIQTAKNLIATAGNGTLIQQSAVALLAKIPQKDLSEDDIEKLIDLLKSILEIFLLIIAALLAAAAGIGEGGGTNVENLIAAIARRDENAKFKDLSQLLQSKGIQLPKNVLPSNVDFEQQIVDVLVEKLPEEQSSEFRKKIGELLDQPLAQEGSSLGTSLQGLVNTSSPDTRADIRQKIFEAINTTALSITPSEKPLSLTQRIRNEVGDAFDALPKELTDAITAELNKKTVVTPGLNVEDRNTFAIARATGLLSPEKAQELVHAFLLDNTKNSGIHGIESAKDTTSKEGDLINELRDAFTKLSKDSSESKFVDKVLSLVADKVRDQTDFFTRSIKLILDPAQLMVRNFSIFTQGTDRGPSQTPLSIPISG